MSWFSTALSAVKFSLNSAFSTQKPKVKSYLRAKADEYYSRIDNVTTVATVAGLGDYLQSKASGNPLGLAVAGKLRDLITAGIAVGMVEMGLDAADALTRREMDKVVACIDRKIDGARL